MPMHNPAHPGEFIRATYVEPFDISIRAISPEMALRLSKALGRSPESWLAMQQDYDLWQTKKSANLSKVKKIQFEATGQTWK